MLNLLLENMGTIVIGALVFLAAAAALRSVVKSRRQGGCGGSCGACSMDCGGHKSTNQHPS